jgi:microcystin-dependent protein
MGQSGGAAAHGMTVAELPPHSHFAAVVTADAVTRSPAASLPAQAHDEIYSTDARHLVASAGDALNGCMLA